MAIPLLLLLFFGSGGMGILRCACDGHTQLLLPSADCCEGESDCMSLTVVEVSDADLSEPPTVAAPILYLPPNHPQPSFTLLLHGAAVETHVCSPPPSVREQTQMVMLV